jgi:hypothetical protein
MTNIEVRRWLLRFDIRHSLFGILYAAAPIRYCQNAAKRHTPVFVKFMLALRQRRRLEFLHLGRRLCKKNTSAEGAFYISLGRSPISANLFYMFRS